jgi:hypothetical protein
MEEEARSTSQAQEKKDEGSLVSVYCTRHKLTQL